jgi:hypothetical protein
MTNALATSALSPPSNHATVWACCVVFVLTAATTASVQAATISACPGWRYTRGHQRLHAADMHDMAARWAEHHSSLVT